MSLNRPQQDELKQHKVSIHDQLEQLANQLPQQQQQPFAPQNPDAADQEVEAAQ